MGNFLPCASPAPAGLLAALDAAGDAVFLLDRSAVIVDTTEPSAQRTGAGLSAGQLRVEPFFPLIHADDLRAVREAFEAALRSGLPTQATARFAADAAQRWLAWRFAPVRGEASGGAAAAGPSLAHAATGASTAAAAPAIGAPVVAIARDVTAEHRARLELEFLAAHDPLTGLPNRARIGEHLASCVAPADADGEAEAFALLLVDVDGIRKVNDAAGPQAGDEALRVTAQRLQDALQARGLVGRFGGDEFLVVLPGALDDAGVARVARTLLGRMQAPLQVGDDCLHVSVSIGSARFPRDGGDVASLLAHADAALLAAKRQGPGSVAAFRPAMRPAARADLALEDALHTGVREGEFLLHFQPIVRAADGQVAGFESLMRWERPGHGLVPPGQFIPMTEANGLIALLGSWALKASCAQVQRFSQVAGRPLHVSVNVSPRQFGERRFAQTVRDALALSGLAPQQLQLEVTEGTMMTDPDHAGQLLRELADLGVRLAVDDFATGYCSLTYLKSLPVHTLKVDRSFVRDLPGSTQDVAICRAIVALAAALGLRTVAEGVETAAQAQVLAELGCTYLQGFHHGRPMRAEDVPALFGRAAGG